ncbi:ABC transporter permease [Paenibacillus baekrokdamisoli]|uniref:ABC transporter permease n=1 Tax=Paenibacillus baekrokdamisoli TaxID=1712516 RepID=A0A3G9JE73_9BACL|nr:carbohydrate ABC transporter permease [Paenibacillus baekrokdamisoli]MBB3071817.1 ABC-type glycerol-3-phosphate transport system permease component [Paenibacillus baekrokdamisoli]BBH24201.1 ABC transporter permease [Paenibacillus baekrokdamisoli]
MISLTRKKAGIHSRRSLTGNILVFSFIGILALFSALPFIFAVITSLKPIDELLQFPPKFSVARPTLANFGDLFQLASNMWVPLFRYVFNTAMVAVLGTIFHVVFAAMAAYPLAKHRFPGKNIIFSIIVMALMFVPQVTFIPQFVLMSKLNLVNSYAALILPWIGASLGLFLMKQFIEQIPDAILEAARIDGASEFTTFFRIVWPNTTPAILTVVIFQFINLWNYSPRELIYSESLKVFRMALEQIVAGDPVARMGAGAAASVILMIPPILVFVFLQRKVVETMTFAGIK